MADDGELTNTHIEDLVTNISTRVWEKVVIFPDGKGLTSEQIQNIIGQNPRDAEAQSTAMLRRWEIKNSENTVKTLAQLLYKQADNGNVKPREIKRILGLTRDQAFATDGASGTGSSGTPGGAAAPASSGVFTVTMLDTQLFNLSRHIVSEGTLRTLATNGLQVRDFVIDTNIRNEKDINEAALRVLKKWKENYEDPTVAYNALCDALRRAGMPMLITEMKQM